MTNALVERFSWLTGAQVIDGLLPWSQPFLPSNANFSEQIARFRNSGFTHVSLTAASGQETSADALSNLGRLLRLLRSADVDLVQTQKEISRARKQGRFTASFHFQSATPFEHDLDTVEAFYYVGVARSILAYNEANSFADGCHEPRNGGLSTQGRALVERMDEIGMRVDLTHCSVRTTLDVLEMNLNTAV